MKYLQLTIAILVLVPLLILSVFFAIIPSAILRLCKAKKASDTWMRKNGTFVSHAIMTMLGVKMHVSGKEHLPEAGVPVCYMCNHQSILDIPGVIAALHIWAGFIAKAELKKVPVLNSWIRSIHCVYIDRKSPRSSIEAILKGVSNIKEGIPMFIFPEGTRSKNGELGEFKAGSLKLATRSKAVIVPIAMKGLRGALEEKRGFNITHCNVVVGKPIPTEDLDEEGQKHLHDEVFKVMSDLYDSLPSGKPER